MIEILVTKLKRKQDKNRIGNDDFSFFAVKRLIIRISCLNFYHMHKIIFSIYCINFKIFERGSDIETTKFHFTPLSVQPRSPPRASNVVQALRSTLEKSRGLLDCNNRLVCHNCRRYWQEWNVLVALHIFARELSSEKPLRRLNRFVIFFNYRLFGLVSTWLNDLEMEPYGNGMFEFLL